MTHVFTISTQYLYDLEGGKDFPGKIQKVLNIKLQKKKNQLDFIKTKNLKNEKLLIKNTSKKMNRSERRNSRNICI